jgi:PAS domain S-box-containing protein
MSAPPTHHTKARSAGKEEKDQDTSAEAERLVQERMHTIQAECEHLRRENARLNQVEKALHEHIEIERALLNPPTDTSVLLDTHGTILSINDTFAQSLGKPPKELIGKVLWTFFPPEVYERRKKLFDEALASGEMVRIEREQNDRWYDVIVNPIFDESGTIIRVAIIVRDITERKRAEEALQESESWFRSLIENATDIIVVLDVTGHIRYASPSVKRVGGYDPVDLVGRHVLEITHPEDVSTVVEAMASARAQPFVRLNFEVRIRDIEGGWHTLDVTGANLLEEKAVQGFVVNARDITERKRAEEALRESEARYRTLVETALDIVLIHDQEKILYINPTGLNLLGASRPDEILGKSPLEIVHPDSLERVRENIAMDLRGDASPTTQLQLLRLDGTHLWVEGKGVTTCIDGKPAVQVIMRDITERKRTEQRMLQILEEKREMAQSLESEREILETIMENTDTLLAYLDYNFNFVRANKTYVAHSGYSREDLIGRNHFDLFPDPENQEIFERARNAGEPIHYIAKPFHYNNQPERGVTYWNWSLVPVKDAEGYIQGFAFSLVDVTEERRTEEKLRELAENLKRSNEDLERFAFISSHDLQEPLRTMVTFSQLLDRRYTGKLDPDADEYLHYIVNAGKRMQNLVQDLLEYSRINTKGGDFCSTVTTAVLEDALTFVHAKAEENRATITYDPLPAVTADPTQLRQVFSNLISNAIKFGKPGVPPVIHISAKKQDGMVQVSVADNGIGIEPQYYDRIFVIFQRLHGMDAYEGTGIGLAIVKRIIDRHGGRIWVESEPGKGSTFHFTVPAAG